MNDEPVAWAVWEGKPHDVFLYKEEADELCRLKGGDAKSVPLYTHPAEHDLGIAESIGFEKGYKAATAKTLTDEEIGDFTHRMVLCCQVHPSSADINVLGLKFIVEDILRKAQGK